MSESTAGEVLYRLGKRLEGALSDFEQHPSGAWSIRESPDFNAIALALVAALYSDIPALAALAPPAPASATTKLREAAEKVGQMHDAKLIVGTTGGFWALMELRDALKSENGEG